jgi:hypothetical protein
MGVVADGICTDCDLERVFAYLIEVQFLHPSFGCCAVGHQQGAVSAFEAAGEQMNPGGDYGRKVFK